MPPTPPAPEPTHFLGYQREAARCPVPLADMELTDAAKQSSSMVSVAMVSSSPMTSFPDASTPVDLSTAGEDIRSGKQLIKLQNCYPTADIHKADHLVARNHSIDKRLPSDCRCYYATSGWAVT